MIDDVIREIQGAGPEIAGVANLMGIRDPAVLRLVLEEFPNSPLRPELEALILELERIQGEIARHQAQIAATY
jgi:hypothetical protein